MNHTIWNKGMEKEKYYSHFSDESLRKLQNNLKKGWKRGRNGEFCSNWTPTLAWLVGACFSDGSVCKYYDSYSKINRYVISFEVSERRLAEEFRDSLKKIGLEPNLSFYDPKEVYRVRKYSVQFYDWFTSLSIDDFKDSIFSKDELAREFTRSTYECEGNLSVLKSERGYTRTQIRISNTNKGVLFLIQDFLDEHNLRFGIYGNTSEKSTKPCYSLYANTKEKAKDFVNLINPCIKNDFSRPRRDREVWR